MSKPVKLTDLLTEGNVWDRNDDGSLPTLADTMRKHAEKKAEMNEVDQQDIKDVQKSVASIQTKLKGIVASLHMDMYDERGEYAIEVASMLDSLELNLTRELKGLKKKYNIKGLRVV